MAYISLSGLNGNAILINNDIILNLSVGGTGGEVTRFYIRFLNQETGYDTEIFTLYPIGSSVKINISPMLKATFLEPNHSTSYSFLTPTENKINSNRYTIYYGATYLEEGVTQVINTSIQRNFVRGGKRDPYTGTQPLAIGTNLRTTELIPVWPGYPTSKYVINSNFYIDRYTNFEDYERLRIKTCEPLYIKFLNSLGGYSYWLFEQTTTEEANTNLGVVTGYNSITDLGNTIEFNLSVYSKVPKRYISLIKDLISSPEIYLFKSNQPQSKAWERISSDRNKVSVVPSKDVYETKLKFKPYYSYNPSLVW